jgi:hypothetical protein
MFKSPKYLMRVNMRPILGEHDLSEISPERVLRGLQQSILKRFRSKLIAAPFSARAKKALAEGISVEFGPSSITIVAKHPAVKPLLFGRRPQQMTWLVKARCPIPIVTETGEIIFRTATPRSMQNGSWYHPGLPSTNILDQARAEARVAVRDNLARDLRRQVQAAFKKNMK